MVKKKARKTTKKLTKKKAEGAAEPKPEEGAEFQVAPPTPPPAREGSPEDLSDLIASISKKMGGAAIITNISQVANPYILRRSTGILSMDVDMRGGWPAGTICQLFGPDGTGKDYLANLTMAANQRKYGHDSNMFWMSFGYKPDLPFMRMAGMQIAYQDYELELMGIDPEKATPEQRGETKGNVMFIDIKDTVKSAKEKPAETLMTAAIQLIQSNKFQIGIINELGSGETKDNVKKGLDEDVKVATFASLMSDFCRKYYTAMRVHGPDGRQNETTVLMINPVRANIGSDSQYNPFTQGSGHALRHAKVIDVHIEHLRYLWEQRDGKKRKAGKEIKWKIMKGKHGISEGAEGSYEFYFNQGVDLVDDVAKAAKAAGVLKRAGRYYDIVDKSHRVDGGMQGVLDALRADPSLVDFTRRAVLDSIRGVSHG